MQILQLKNEDTLNIEFKNNKSEDFHQRHAVGAVLA